MKTKFNNKKEIKAALNEAISHSARLKLEAAKQKENWVLNQIPTSLEDRVKLETEIAEQQTIIRELKKILDEFNNNDNNLNLVEFYWRAIKEILEEKGMGDLIDEAKIKGKAEFEVNSHLAKC